MAKGGIRKGAGRKPVNVEGKSAFLGVTVPPALIAALDEMAAAKEISRSQMVAELIRRAAKRAKRS